MKSVQIRSYFWSVFSCIPTEFRDLHVKSFQIRSCFWSAFPCIWTEYRKIQTEITPYLDTFHAVAQGQLKSLLTISATFSGYRIATSNFILKITFLMRLLIKLFGWLLIAEPWVTSSFLFENSSEGLQNTISILSLLMGISDFLPYCIINNSL